MALKDLRTNLKSLRYSKDRLGGGTSNQPYIVSNIPTGDNIGQTGGPDFLLRGGLLTPGRIANDVSRLTQMFFDFKSPNGLLFTAKQNVLSRTAVATQASGAILNEGIYLPTSTILAAAGTPLGLHLNKQGIDPTKRTGPDAGQKGLFDLLGIRDPLGLPVYTEVVARNQEARLNRLVSLKDSKIVGNPVATTNPNNISDQDLQLLKYEGGPGSVLGIGNTIIKRYSNTSEGLDFQQFDTFANYNIKVFSPSQLANQTSAGTGAAIKEDFRKSVTGEDYQVFNNIPISLDYTRFNIEQRVNLGDPGKKGNKSSYTLGKDINGVREPLDKLNALPLYISSDSTTNSIQNDLVKFRIGVIDNNNPTKKTYIHFRAFIDSMDDNYSSDWQTVKYMGRGENFYRYNGFDRSVNLSWTVAAQSKQELIPMYQKLNYLASVCAPDYSDIGYMRGNLIELTVGGYLFKQVGIMKGITYTVPTESPWEIAISDYQNLVIGTQGEALADSTVKELPHYIKVTGFQFIPIHNFVPRVQQNGFDGPSSPVEYEGGGVQIQTFGDERYIALASSGENNYNIDNYSLGNLRKPVEAVGTVEPVGIQPLTQEGQGLQGSGIGIPAQGFPG